MPGRVIREQRGAGGFGYDVLFVPDDQDGELTSAEMTSEAKDAISHRGRALREVAPVVVAVLGGADGGWSAGCCRAASARKCSSRGGRAGPSTPSTSHLRASVRPERLELSLART